MGPSDNAHAPNDPLPVGLVGAGERLEQLVPAVQRCAALRIIAQAGMPEAHALPDVPHFDDIRVLAAQAGIRAVLVAGGTKRAVEIAADVHERGVPVWRLPPLARYFAEGTEIARHVQRDGGVYRVASWWEQVTDHAWKLIDWPADFRPSYSELRISAPGPALDTWRVNRNAAGGGVLVSDAVRLLEALVAVRGLPETVSAAVGNYRGAGAESRDTEDTALAVLRYADGGTGLIRAAWSLPPAEERLLHSAPAGCVVLTTSTLARLDPDGAVREQHPLPDDWLADELFRFAGMMRSGARDRAAAPLGRHLAVTALVESIYLAARTGQSESPRKLYESQKWPEPTP